MRFGPFELENRIAVGGTAEVYVARPVDPKAQPQRLVVKRLLPDFLKDAEGRTMFEREAALHAAVKHGNVVKVFATGQTDQGEPYLAMELIDGMDASRLVRRLPEHDHRRPVNSLAPLEERLKISAAGQPFAPRKSAGQTVSRFRPFARRRLRTFRPPLVFIRSRKP